MHGLDFLSGELSKFMFSDGDHEGLSALLGAASPDLALASDASDSLPLPDNDNGNNSINKRTFLKQ